jgi:PPOX class probable F420-dependent enzyme
MTTTLDEVMELAKLEHYLAVVATLRDDLTIQASLVNAGAMLHPITGEPTIAFVTYGVTKLRNLRARPQVSITYRSSWTWATVEGLAEIIGPDDPNSLIDGERYRLLMREVFVAAGGEHDDWEAYDRTMVEQRRAAVFVPPSRIYSN